MRALICLLTGHRFSPWRALPVRRGLRVVVDVAARDCACCHRREVDRLRPFWS